ncbi:SVP1-like protein 2 [Podosphaera aphanis]|nr:SVP1-like protein 2 [Podosphaera aphanis]
MNARPAIENSISPTALSASFNQDASCFAVGRDRGFCIYDSDPCRLRVSRDVGAGISNVQMFGRTNFIALIGRGKQSEFPMDQVIIWDDARQKVSLKISAPSEVRGTCVSRTHVVITLLNSVRVYEFLSPPVLRHMFETADNHLGLCCLSDKILAFPGRTAGQVQLTNLSTGKVSIIPAHGSPLRALNLSQNGEILATASQTGTLIRLFATHNCVRLAELRRGVDRSTIFSLAISPSCDMLAVTSDKSTLHLFDIPKPNRPSTVESGHNIRSSVSEASTKKWGILGRLPLLPRVFSDIYSFASTHFEMGDEQTNGDAQTGSNGLHARSTVKANKGIIGWVDNESIIVLGAGTDCRWEQFVIARDGDDRRHCFRKGWKKYLNNS